MKRDTLAAVISDLRRSLARLEALTARDGRSLQQQILDVLGDCGALSTAAVTRLVHRRRTDVLTTLRTMHAAKQIDRQNERWVLID